MKNFVQQGETLNLTAPAGGVVSGTAYKIGSVVVVALADAAVGETFQGRRCGVFTLPVTTAETPSEGAKAYFKSDNTISTTSTSNTLVGVFLTAKDADDNAEVLFTGQVV